MNKTKADPKGNTIKNTLDTLTSRSRTPKVVYVLLLLLYIAANIITSTSANSNQTINLAGLSFSAYSFAGVFSSLGNICVIFLTVYCGKPGYITSLALLLFQIPVILRGIVMNHNYNSIPGVFGNILAIIAVTIIYFNNRSLTNYQNRLRDQAVTDRLTELPNRFACTELVGDLIKRNTRFVLVSIDLNGFKSINDTMGFNTGNEVLRQIASRWKTIADTGLSGTLDFITRVSGDEFVLIIRGYDSETDILNTIQHYEAVLGNRLTIDDCDFYITASFGYAEFPTDTKDVDSLFTYADAAMTEIKRAHSSNHVMRFSTELLKMERTIEIENKIREALEHDTVFFQLQPQFDMSHKLRGFEALARMRDENGKIISPGEFIPVAEKVGLIDKVDAAVFQKSGAFFGDLLRRSGADISLSINISVRHLMKNDFLDEIRSLLRDTGIPPQQLEIEITESIMIDSAEKALQCINEIRSMGIMVAIDDFGTGYSSLSYLNNFPANLLKIDKSFIDKMNTSDSSKQYVAAIISIGHIMGFDVISEGVETEDQLATLNSIGCDYIQGFIWGRPLPQEEAEKLVMASVQTQD